MKNLLFTALVTIAFASKTRAQIPNYVPSSGIVGWWPFNGNANDESGNGNNGAVNGANLAADRFGSANSAYSFDGASSIVVNTPSFTFIENQDFSVSCYAYVTPQSISDPFVGYGNVAPGNFVWYLGEYSSIMKFGVAKQQSSWSDIALPSSTTFPELNSWYHIVGVKNNGVISLYINGVSVGSANQIIQGAIGTNLPLTFGWFTGTGQYMNGKLDDIGIWNRALSEQEIQALYNGCSVASNSILGNITPGVFTAETYSCTNNLGSTYQWTISNGVITAGQGTNSVNVLWAGTGLGTISVQETTSANCQSDTIAVNVVVIPTGLEELNQSAIELYPNPANTHITIDYGNFAKMNDYQIKVQNSLGQQVFQNNISQQTDYLSLSSWGGNGLYFIHILDPQGNTIAIRKIILQ